MMRHVLIRKEILPCPEGMELPEDPERPWKKVRTPAVLPQGRRSHAPIIGDTVVVLSEEEVAYATGHSVSMTVPAETTAVVVAKTGAAELVLEVDGDLVTVPPEAVHVVTAVPKGQKSRWEFGEGTLLVCLQGTAQGGICKCQADHDGYPLRSLRVSWIHVPEAVDPVSILSVPTEARGFREATEEDLAGITLPTPPHVPEGRMDALDIRPGDLVRMRPRREVILNYPDKVYAIDYSTSMTFMEGWVFRVLEIQESPTAHGDRPAARVLMQPVSHVAEYEAAKAARPRHAGKDWVFSLGMLAHVPQGESIAAVPPPPGWLRAGDLLEFQEFEATSGSADSLGRVPEMAYLKGARFRLVSPAVVHSESQQVSVVRDTEDEQAKHLADLLLHGRWDDWQYRAGMFRKVTPQE
jgi:hypothetical protein